MSPSFQTVVVLGIVALTAGSFIWHSWKGRKKTGCGNSCACPSRQMKKQ